MKTGIEKGPLVFPHAGAFTLLVSLKLQGRGKSSLSCITSSNGMALPSLFPLMPCFRALDHSTNELVGLDG